MFSTHSPFGFGSALARFCRAFAELGAFYFLSFPKSTHFWNKSDLYSNSSTWPQQHSIVQENVFSCVYKLELKHGNLDKVMSDFLFYDQNDLHLYVLIPGV